MKLFSFKKKKPSALGAQEAKQKKETPDKKRGFFGSRQESTEKKEETREVPEAAPVHFGSASEVILRPRITEKGTDMASHSGAYVFDVDPDATKQEIQAGVEDLYNVKVIKVRTTSVPRKRVRSNRGIRGMKGGGKKAYVYLQAGDTIEFV